MHNIYSLVIIRKIQIIIFIVLFWLCVVLDFVQGFIIFPYSSYYMEYKFLLVILFCII